jgi:hypothetical protein
MGRSMSRVVDMTRARPGERFRFRMIGTPKSWFRYYVDDGSHLDSDKKLEGIPSTRIFSTFAKDLDDGNLCVVVMLHELAKILARKFKMMKVHPGSEFGVDVDITIVYGAIDYLIDVGSVAEDISSDMIDQMEKIWDSVKDDVMNISDDECIAECNIVDWTPSKWVGISNFETDMVLNACSEEPMESFIPFLLKASECSDSELSLLASRILRSIRANEEC